MNAPLITADDLEDKRNQALIRRLQEEFSCPEEEIKRIYLEVLNTLREGARIMDYLPLLTYKKVRDIYKSSGLKSIVGK